MSIADRIFWGVIIFIGINLLWVGVIEFFLPLPVGVALSIVAALGIVFFGPKPKDEMADHEV